MRCPHPGVPLHFDTPGAAPLTSAKKAILRHQAGEGTLQVPCPEAGGQTCPAAPSPPDKQRQGSESLSAVTAPTLMRWQERAGKCHCGRSRQGEMLRAESTRQTMLRRRVRLEISASLSGHTSLQSLPRASIRHPLAWGCILPTEHGSHPSVGRVGISGSSCFVLPGHGMPWLYAWGFA